MIKGAKVVIAKFTGSKRQICPNGHSLPIDYVKCWRCEVMKDKKK